MMKLNRTWLGWVLLVVMTGVFALPQLNAQGPTATISGTVSDATGAVIPNAKIEIRNGDTGSTQTATADAQGRYRAPALPIGNFTVQASAQGFQSVARQGIILSVGNESVVDFSLAVGESQQTVSVTADVSQVETTSAAVTSLVDQSQMRQLPLNGRNFEQLILLAPGVQAFYNNTQNAFTGKGSEYSISGSRPEGQALLMDNQDVANFWGRGMGAPSSGTSLGVESIAEFQMLTSTYGAQYGGSGGAMNSVTKSGTNGFHGSAYDFLRNSSLDARTFFQTISGTSVPPFRKNQFGGSLGGPIKKDKMFFFVNYEGIRQLLGETTVVSVPDANAHNGYLPCSAATAYSCNPQTNLAYVGFANAGVQNIMNAYPVATTPTSGGIGTIVESGNQIVHEDYAVMRFDYSLSSKDSLFVRYLLDRVDQTEPFPLAGLPYWVEGDTTRNQFATIEERRIISPSMVNSFRFTFSRPLYTGATTTHAPNNAFNFYAATSPGRQDGSLQISGLTNEGPDLQAPYTIAQNKFGESDDLIINKGAHSIKVGMGVTRDDLNSSNYYRWGGYFVFNSLLSFMQASPTSVSGVIPGQQYGNRDLRATEYIPYFQDDWKVLPRLTLNLGLRYEFQTNPTEAHNQLYEIVNPVSGTGFTHVSNVFQNGNPSKENWDPRVGVAWDPFNDHKTSVRAGFGIFHSLLTYHTYMPSVWSSAPELFTTQAGTAANPITGFPTPFAGLSSSFPYQEQPAFDYNTNTTPYVIQWNATVQRDIAKNTTLTVGYNGSRGNHLFVPYNLNPPKYTIDSNGVYHFGTQATSNGRQIIVPAALTNSNYSILSGPGPVGWSSYHGLQVGLNRRFAKNATFQVSYTYSHCEDIGSSFSRIEGGANGGDVQNPYNIAAEKGLCSFDIREALRVNGSYTLPFHANKFVEGWQVSAIFAAQDGTPVTVADGFDQAGTQGTERPNYSPNNAGCNGQTILGTWQHWYNPNCFTLQAPGTLGNLGRDNLPGPGLVNADVSILKDTRVPKLSEQFNVQFRAEFFNVFNHVNFANTATAGGLCTQATNGGCNYAGNAGQITNIVGTARQIQFGLKILF